MLTYYNFFGNATHKKYNGSKFLTREIQKMLIRLFVALSMRGNPK